MLKRDLVNAVAEEMGAYLKKDVSQAVDIMLDTIVEALAEDRRDNQEPQDRQGHEDHLPQKSALHHEQIAERRPDSEREINSGILPRDTAPR